MTAEITYSVDMETLIEFLEKENGVKIPHGAEYVTLKPKQIDDYLELKVLYSSESHPREWRDYQKIKENWEKEL